MSNTRKLDFTVTKDMDKKAIIAKVEEARKYFKIKDLSPAKKHIIDLCLKYGDQLSAFKFGGRDKSRYAIYSNILNNERHLDDLHFAHYAVKQLCRIPSGSNSDLRAVLPVARAKREYLMAPGVASMKKASLGVMMFGMTSLLAGIARESGAAGLAGGGAILTGAFTYYTARDIVIGRLENSLNMVFNQALTNGSSQPAQLHDGLDREVNAIQNTGVKMLGAGVTMFDKIGNQFDRFVGIAQSPQQPAIDGPRVEDVTDQEEQQQPRFGNK